jgi:hypothetical protein
MRTWLTGVGCLNLLLAHVLHDDPIGYFIGALCLLFAALG